MESKERYAKQWLLPEIGQRGQRCLSASTALCIGAGGLGCASLPYLAGAGVGRIVIVDDDRVDLSNLHRQVMFTEADIGQLKAEVAAHRMRALNRTIVVEPVTTRLGLDNVEALVTGADVILDGSDNYATKYLVADASVRFGTPLVYGSATGMEAMVTVFHPDHGPCLRCLFPQAPEGWVPNCAEAGVLGPLVGAAGCMQAAEAVQIMAGQRRIYGGLVGKLWLLDARNAQVRVLSMSRRADCPTCSGPRESIKLESPDPIIPTLTPDQLNRHTRLIDVREADEYAAGHIQGAINLPLSRLQARDFNAPPRGPTVIYCETGRRCLLAAPLLRAAGVGPLSVLSEWRRSPVYRKE